MAREDSWLRDVEVTRCQLTPAEQASVQKRSAATERHNAAVARLARRGEVATVGCSLECDQHRGHVYVLCYGEPVQVGDSDVNVSNRMSDPISHYVGFTGGVPIKRIERHGAMSQGAVAEIRPGTLADEERTKFDGRCAFCGSGLRYWEESAHWRDRYVPRMLERLEMIRAVEPHPEINLVVPNAGFPDDD